jgi:hypothetical protein
MGWKDEISLARRREEGREGEVSLPRPVAHLLCNRQVLRVVLDGLAEVTLRLARVAEALLRPALPRPVAHLL